MHTIILVHGLLGYRRFLLWRMFADVVDSLEREGFRAVQAIVHPTASIKERAENLLECINKTVPPGESCHIIGHSMGGLDARYLASPNGLNQGGRIATITTVSTPHRGSTMAAQIPNFVKTVVSYLSKAGQYLIPGESGEYLSKLAQNRWVAFEQLTPKYLEETFNPRIIDHPDVDYYSFAGQIELSYKSPSDWPRIPFWRGMKAREGINDGMVSVESAKWGTFKGVLPADHGQQIGLIVIPWATSPFDHLTFFTTQAKELARKK